MTAFQLFRAEENPPFAHAPGIRTQSLLPPRPGAELCSGISRYAPGTAATPHRHNCDEFITVLAGHALLQVDGQCFTLNPLDSAWVRAGALHCYQNSADGELSLMWIYNSAEVSRSTADDRTSAPLLTPST